MNNLGIKKSINFGNGTEVSIETGKLAKQADGSVVVRVGDTMLLATAVSAKEAKDGIDFLPLTVDYREKYASAGKFPGGFFKREGRPSDLEVLTMRLVDRALRPLFPDDYHADTQVMIQLLSYDGINLPDALACLAASTALSVSDIPFGGPVSEVRVGRVEGKLIINPTVEELKASDVDVMVAGTQEDIVMLEGEMDEISEEELVQIIEAAHTAIQVQCKLQLELANEIEKSKVKREYEHETNDADLEKAVNDACYDKCYDIAKQGLADKHKRSELFEEVLTSYKEGFSEEELEEKEDLIKKYFGKTKKEAVRNVLLKEGIRLDGRSTTEIRPIWTEVDYLPMTHGSAIFTRGETQSLTTLTLGGKLDEQTVDGALGESSENFLLHYNFPPFSTGEARPIRGVSRREVGHGNLALRALKGMIPEDNAYTIRLVSEILESNGSSSMATVCAGTLALMDGGVKIKAPVSGIAMGLITDGNDFAVLSDILGDEDHLGDMDFKVTGTEKGITACQMDIKINGLSFEVLTKALHQAREGRLHIMKEMLKSIDQPREDYKSHVPRIISLTIPNDMIGAVIGPGGKIIQEIQKETETTITLEENDKGEGVVEILSPNAEKMAQAEKRIRNIAFPPTVEVGEEYEGKVKSIMPYGAFVEILPGTDGLIHISEMEWRKVQKVEEVMKEGDMVKFKVVGKDPKSGKFKLSRKVLLPKEENA